MLIILAVLSLPSLVPVSGSDSVCGVVLDDVSEQAQRENLLSWAPPLLENPTTIRLTPDDDGPYILDLDTDKDYIIELPDEPLPGGLSIEGGRNVQLIGGEISIPWQGDDASITSRRMLKIQDATGIVHIEGLLGRGEDLSEGIQIGAPEAIVQIQNVRIENMHARDQVNFSDNHPDLLQPWGNAREIRIDHFTGTTDYQGFFLKCNIPDPQSCALGRVVIRRTNIIGLPTARYLFWVEQNAAGEGIVLDNVWLDVPQERWREQGRLAQAVWPDYREDAFGAQRARIGTDAWRREYVTWPNMTPMIEGRIYEGLPPGGAFVPYGTAVLVMFHLATLALGHQPKVSPAR